MSTTEPLFYIFGHGRYPEVMEFLALPSFSRGGARNLKILFLFRLTTQVAERRLCRLPSYVEGICCCLLWLDNGPSTCVASANGPDVAHTVRGRSHRREFQTAGDVSRACQCYADTIARDSWEQPQPTLCRCRYRQPGLVDVARLTPADATCAQSLFDGEDNAPPPPIRLIVSRPPSSFAPTPSDLLPILAARETVVGRGGGSRVWVTCR